MTTAAYQVTGMSCEHCERAIRQEVGEVTGLQVTQIDAQTGCLVVSSAGPVSDAAVLAAVDEAGYTAVRV